MKKLYTLMAAAALALGANAQVYLCGEGDGLGWDPAAPLELTLENDVYTVNLTNVAKFKMSNTKGTWDEYNAGAKVFDFNAETLGTAWDLRAGDADVVVAKGDYTVTFNKEFTTITMVANSEVGPIDYSLYIRGQMNDWGAPAEWKFTEKGENTYWFNCEGATMIPAGTTFKIADDAWGRFNYGCNDEKVVPDEEPTPWFAKGGDAVMDADYTGTIKVYIDPETEAEYAEVTVFPSIVEWEEAGIEGVIVDENAPAEYFNLQGVRVANPANGLFIVRKGNNVSKVLVK